ncbi:MAG: HNH endonuclease, partial [Bacteroidota bacterium]
MLIRESVLVLNQDYQAIGVCSVERAFVLVLLKKAEMLSDFPDRKLRSVSADFSIPSIIRLYRYVSLPYK